MAQHVIIGNGVAGVKAAETIRQNDKDSEITMICDEETPFYYRPQLSGLILDRTDETRLKAKNNDFYKANNINLMLGKKAVEVSPERQEVALEDGTSLKYTSVLIASGGSPILPEYPGGDADGVVTLKTISDAQNIKEKVKKARSAVVVGNGFIASYLMEALVGKGLKVTYIIRGDGFWQEVIDADASSIIETRLKQQGIDVLKNVDIQKIEKSGGKVSGARTTDGKLIQCELVGMIDGLSPNVDFLGDSGVDVDLGVLVDDSMRTNVEGIYAAGDVAQLKAAPADTPKITVRWLKAWRQGRIAGANMSGKEQEFEDISSATSTQIFGRDLVAIGVSNVLNNGYEIMRGEFPHPETDVYKKLVIKDEKVVGALLMGNAAEGTAIAKVMREGAPISAVDKNLLRQMFDLYFVVGKLRGILCPVCKLHLTLDADAKEGDVITCPACGIEIRLTKSLLRK